MPEANLASQGHLYEVYEQRESGTYRRSKTNLFNSSASWPLAPRSALLTSGVGTTAVHREADYEAQVNDSTTIMTGVWGPAREQWQSVDLHREMYCILFSAPQKLRTAWSGGQAWPTEGSRQTKETRQRACADCPRNVVLCIGKVSTSYIHIHTRWPCSCH